MTTILLIDDETDVRESIARVLERENYTVETAENAEVGLAILSKEAIDLLISDVIMPGMNGVQVIREIRKSNPNIKVIAISGGGNFGPKAYQPEAITTTAYLQAAIEAGADCVLTKPFERAELVDCVHHVLDDETPH